MEADIHQTFFIAEKKRVAKIKKKCGLINRKPCVLSLCAHGKADVITQTFFSETF